MVIVWFFLRTDILTAFIGTAAFYFVFRAVPLLMIPSVLYTQSVIVILFLFFGFILWSIYSIATKDKALDFDSLSPAYAARITERERLKRELEIAEEVQISFLPKEDPVLKEISIASRCIPASEVGGDYYDYIHFDDNSIGIVIGDVSGKGIQASFYMTLVKGFLKAVAKQTSSTSGILNKLNELFCENVEKGNFITMVFAKISLAEKRLVFSRAGHNPILIRHFDENKTISYQPKGFALGMEMTGQFPRFIEEENVQLKTGDLIVFYTDGITEAMNKKKEEYGTDRLVHLLNELKNETPVEVIDKVYKDVKNFIGRAPQHDDMTMVVVKVN
jgi:serine phosphatase RsbU (regulator of sigma subunit)